jgi:hypothetical protein
MADLQSCFVYVASDERLPEQVEIRDRITDVFPSGTAGGAQVAVVTWQRQTVDALGVLKPGMRVANYKTRVTINAFRELEDPVPIGELLKAVEGDRERSEIEAAFSSGGQLTAEAALALRRALQHLRPYLDEEWQELEDLARNQPTRLWAGDGEPIVAYERDAVGLALDIAGMQRAEVLREWRGDADAPFLEGLGQFRAGEDSIIAHDAQVFGDWEVLGPSLVGITEFRRGGRVLTVVNANRQPVERTLGVDLLYYVHDFQAYVLVQYKRLTRGTHDWEFRPSRDGGFSVELDRMRKIGRPGADSGKPADHRLGDNFCFVKFCKPTTARALPTSDTELAEGMYLPLDYLDKLTASGQLAGPRQGVVIRYDNVGRWLNNTAFTMLVERAWVGTRGLTTRQVTKMVEQGLRAGHSVVIAAGQVPAPRPRR